MVGYVQTDAAVLQSDGVATLTVAIYMPTEADEHNGWISNSVKVATDSGV